jgi:hypothetical protein
MVKVFTLLGEYLIIFLAPALISLLRLNRMSMVNFLHLMPCMLLSYGYDNFIQRYSVIKCMYISYQVCIKEVMMCMTLFDGKCMNCYDPQGHTLVIYLLFYYYSSLHSMQTEVFQ